MKPFSWGMLLLTTIFSNLERLFVKYKHWATQIVHDNILPWVFSTFALQAMHLRNGLLSRTMLQEKYNWPMPDHYGQYNWPMSDHYGQAPGANLGLKGSENLPKSASPVSLFNT